MDLQHYANWVWENTSLISALEIDGRESELQGPAYILPELRETLEKQSGKKAQELVLASSSVL